jgi:tetratricopeptide (TPR) repeat protein
MARQKHQMPNAIEQLLEYSLLLASKTERAAGRTIKYIEIADTFLEYGHKSRCLEILAEGAQKIDSVKQPLEKAKILAWLARLFTEAGEGIKGRELFARAALLARATETPSQKFEALYRIACEYAGAKLLDEANLVLSELHEIACHPPIGVDVVQELIDIAEISADIGRDAKAAEILAEALNLTPALKDIWFRAERLSELAEIYAGAGSRDQASQVLEHSLSAVNQIDEASRPYFLLKITDVYLAMGNRPQADDMLQKILDIVSKDELAYSRSGGLIELAERYVQLGETANALKISLQAQDIAAGNEETQDKIANFTEIGRILGEVGELDKALDIAGKSFDLCLKLEDKKAQIYLLGNLARLFIDLNNREKSAAAVSEIIRIVGENRARTAGLAAIAADLAQGQEYCLALELAQIIREPEARSSALAAIARDMVEAKQEPAEEIKRLVREIISEN